MKNIANTNRISLMKVFIPFAIDDVVVIRVGVFDIDGVDALVVVFRVAISVSVAVVVAVVLNNAGSTGCVQL